MLLWKQMVGNSSKAQDKNGCQLPAKNVPKFVQKSFVNKEIFSN